MFIICAWCGHDLGTKPGHGTTHGICKACLDRELAACSDKPPQHPLPPPDPTPDPLTF